MMISIAKSACLGTVNSSLVVTADTDGTIRAISVATDPNVIRDSELKIPTRTGGITLATELDAACFATRSGVAVLDETNRGDSTRVLGVSVSVDDLSWSWDGCDFVADLVAPFADVG